MKFRSIAAILFSVIAVNAMADLTPEEYKSIDRMLKKFEPKYSAEHGVWRVSKGKALTTATTKGFVEDENVPPMTFGKVCWNETKECKISVILPVLRLSAGMIRPPFPVVVSYSYEENKAKVFMEDLEHYRITVRLNQTWFLAESDSKFEQVCKAGRGMMIKFTDDNGQHQEAFFSMDGCADAFAEVEKRK